MTPLAALILAATVASVSAQEKQAEISKDRQVVQPEQAKKPPVEVRTSAPNQIGGPKVRYSGALVQTAKTSNPLQLINPFAPAQYGSGYDNLTRDPTTGRARGLTLFSVDF